MKKQLISSLIISSLISFSVTAKESHSYQLKDPNQTARNLVGAGIITMYSSESVKYNGKKLGLKALIAGIIVSGIGIASLAKEAFNEAKATKSTANDYKRFKRKLKYAKATGISPKEKSIIHFINTADFPETKTDIEKINKLSELLSKVEEVSLNDIDKTNFQSINKSLASDKVRSKLSNILQDEANEQNLTFMSQLLAISLLGSI